MSIFHIAASRSTQDLLRRPIISVPFRAQKSSSWLIQEFQGNLAIPKHALPQHVPNRSMKGILSSLEPGNSPAAVGLQDAGFVTGGFVGLLTDFRHLLMGKSMFRSLKDMIFGPSERPVYTQVPYRECRPQNGVCFPQQVRVEWGAVGDLQFKTGPHKPTLRA